MIASASLRAASPLEGTWYNGFCSRVDLKVSETGQISGIYTSHTGSTGSSSVLGQLDSGVSLNVLEGVPFALGIQWRLINQDQSKADGSWHWVSMFSGQYHPAQDVSVPGQETYSIPDTIELLNLLIATATLPGLTDTVPVTWPESLIFHRTPPDYCHGVTPGTPVPYSPTASDNVSGIWLSSNGGRLQIKADASTGELSGGYEDTEGNMFNVIGLYDTLAPPSSGAYFVSMQGVTLSLIESGSVDGKRLKSLSGGVYYRDSRKMVLWSSEMRSTSWTERFVQQSLDMETLTKQ